MSALPLTQHTGRKAPARNRFTFPSSGVTVEFHKVSPLISQLISEALLRYSKGLPPDHPFAYPEEPTQPMDYGDGEIRHEKLPETAWTDEYREKRGAWITAFNNRVATRLMSAIVLDYIVFNPEDIDEGLSRLERSLKRFGGELINVQEGFLLDGVDLTEAEERKLQYYLGCCMLDQNPQGEGQAFMRYVFGQSQPREEAVDSTIASFRTPGE